MENLSFRRGLPFPFLPDACLGIDVADQTDRILGIRSPGCLQ